MLTYKQFLLKESVSMDIANDILDKISKSGIKSLSQHEMTLLKAYSDKNFDAEEEIQKHQNKFLTAKSVVKGFGLDVNGHELEKDIGRFVKFKIKKGDRQNLGLIVWMGTIYEIVGIQKHWGYDENGKYVPDRIGYRVAEVGENRSFGRVCGTDQAIFVNITEEEAININKKIMDEFKKGNYKRINYKNVLKES